MGRLQPFAAGSNRPKTADRIALHVNEASQRHRPLAVLLRAQACVPHSLSFKHIAMDSTGGTGMFGTLFKRIYKGKIASPLSLITSAVCGSETSTLPDAANDPVIRPAFDELAQHVLQDSRTAK
ncbi:hypothetical protein [Pseudomonas moorei]|uniref:hypothetical protein n=1 Tax=Pseudomonas moorei TaxID=395599 RepID=UPI001FF47295|nr:hypothetical protein [Pseudomonas moorei]